MYKSTNKIKYNYLFIYYLNIIMILFIKRDSMFCIGVVKHYIQ